MVEMSFRGRTPGLTLCAIFVIDQMQKLPLQGGSQSVFTSAAYRKDTQFRFDTELKTKHPIKTFAIYPTESLKIPIMICTTSDKG